MRIAVEPVLLACCAVEVATAMQSPPGRADLELVSPAEAPEITVVVIAGTITTVTEPLIRARIAAVDGPCAVVAFGVCASSGGPYWDSHAVVQGWSGADRFVPGCPPPAQVFWGAVVDAASEVIARAAG